MADTLTDRIRARLSTWESDHDTDACTGPCAVTTGIAAMRTVLDLHRAYDPNPGNPLTPYLCRADGEPYPCQTVQAIAAPLGITEES